MKWQNQYSERVPVYTYQQQATWATVATNEKQRSTGDEPY
jgi:hypothetical protein